MSRKEKINQEVEKTLNSFEKTKEIENNPYFYTKLSANIGDTKSLKQRTKFGFFSRLSPIFFFLLAAVNIYTFVDLPSNQSVLDSEKNYSTILSEEYSLNSYSDYQLNISDGE